jgi:phage shock protein PspC (stress-responsive transcriptional regulator)
MVSGPAANHDGDMNETLNDPGQPTGPAPQSPPPPVPPHQDLDRLRRSTSNRYIAGVAGGLGRHFGIDPTIIRVLLVVLTFFGGAGLLVYVACWLFVPEDDTEHAPVRVGAEPRKILLIAAAGIAVLLAVGDVFDGADAGWPFVGIAVIVAIVLIVRDRRRERDAATDGRAPMSPAPAPYSPAPYSPGQPGATGSGPAYATVTEDVRAADGAAQPPAWQPPVVQPPLVAPRPRRTGIVWFWPTLALIAVALGVLGLYDNDHHVADGAYPALALGITAVMLLVGSLVGRPGGLILIAFVSSVALAASVAIGGSFGTDAREVHETPTSAALVQNEYTGTVGEIVLDLTEVSDPEALAGRTIHVQLRTGSIEVIVPRTLNLVIDADMDFAGGIAIPGDDSGGINHEAHKRLSGEPATTSAPLELDLDAKLGQITVEYQ